VNGKFYDKQELEGLKEMAKSVSAKANQAANNH
jgi:hypothetical protein